MAYTSHFQLAILNRYNTNKDGNVDIIILCIYASALIKSMINQFKNKYITLRNGTDCDEPVQIPVKVIQNSIYIIYLYKYNCSVSMK